MSEDPENTVPGGNEPQSPVGEGKSDFVSKDFADKVLTEKKNFQRKYTEAMAELNEFRSQQKAQAEQKMLEEKKFSELIDQQKSRISELESLNSQHLQEKTDFRKMNAALNLLQQKGVNLESKYMGLVHIDKIQLSESGEIDATSVAEVVDSFQKEHPRLTIPQKRLLPNLKSGDVGSKMTIDEWNKLGPEEASKALREGRVENPWKK